MLENESESIQTNAERRLINKLHITRENVSPATGSQQKYKVHQTEPQSAGSPRMRQELRLCSLQGQSTKLKGNHGEKGAPQGELYADRQTVPSSQEALPEHICSEEEPPSPNGSLPLPWNCEPALTACYVHKLHTCRSTFKISKNTNCMLLNKTFAWLLFCEQYNPTTIYRAFTLH